MSIDVGFNFRSTLAFVTDGANEYFVPGSTGSLYPVTIGGLQCGWTTDIGASVRNRASGIDRRLSGIHFNNVVGKTFRVDLPATGDYDIYLAAGDTTVGNSYNWDLCDNATVFKSLSGNLSAVNRWVDANGTELTTSTWPTSNVPVRWTFTSTIFKLVINAVSGSGNNVIAHLRIVQIAATSNRRRRVLISGGGIA